MPTPEPQPPSPTGEGNDDQAKDRCPNNPLLEDLRQTGSLRLIVTLDIGFTPEAELNQEQAAEQRRTIAESQEWLIAELEGTRAEVLRRYERFPLLALEVDEPALCRLLASALVRSVEVDRPDPPTTTELLDEY